MSELNSEHCVESIDLDLALPFVWLLNTLICEGLQMNSQTLRHYNHALFSNAPVSLVESPVC